VLVTGATGFAGGYLVEHLAKTSAVIGWGRSSPPPAVAGVGTWQVVDLLDRAQVRRAIADIRPSAVYHAAGVPQVADSWNDTAGPLAGHVLATAHLLDAIRLARVPCRILVTGSAAVYAGSDDPISETGPLAPVSPYALSKLAQEQLALRAYVEDGLPVIVARAFNHTGPRQSDAFVAPSIARQIALIERGLVAPVIRVGNLDARRDLSDVRDIVRAYVALMERGQPGVVYNVGSGVGRSIRALLAALLSRSRTPVRVETDPQRLRPADVPALVADCRSIREVTGWTPAIPFEQMLDDLLEYWRGCV
jgi:GDP-4-dehydro-6-deoxy-D-mannose reductase